MRMNLVLLSLVLVACSSGAPNGTGGAGRGMAVVNTDFKSTTISLVDPSTGTLQKDDCLDSGAVTPILSMALSGDVVLASQPQPTPELLIIDRTNSALIWLDPKTCVVSRELSVGTGFYANPHDALGISASKAYVARNSANATPSGVAGANDQGNDLLIIDPSAPSITGRIDMSSYATAPATGTAAVVAGPDRMLLANGKVYVALDEISADLSTIGASRIVIVDPTTDTVAGTIDVPGLLDCTGLSYVESTKRLLVTCNGNFDAALADQVAVSGVLVYDVSGATPVLEKTLPASGVARPFSNTAFAAVGDSTALIVVNGDFSGAPPDSLYALDLGTGATTKLFDAGGGYILASAVFDPDNKRAFVTDAEAMTPVVQVYDVSNPAAITKLSSFDANPKTGLPPGQISWY